MKKMFKLAVLSLVLTLSSTILKAQSTSLCDGVKYIYSNLTKANFDKLPEEYASKMAGWKAVMKYDDDDTYSYTFEYEVKKESDVDGVFKKFNNQLASCLGAQPEIEGDGPDSEAAFEYKEGVVRVYQRWSTKSQWIMISVSR